MGKKIVLFFVVAIVAISNSESSVLTKRQVVIDQGILEGASLTTDDGYLYNVFYAVPFAAPPIGRLRFKAPEPANGWEGIRDATSPGPVCFQLSGPGNGFEGEEDCLYLNIYVPATVYNISNLPVLFWIHGGGFVGGAANYFDSKFLVERDVIVITTNYRPGFTGFMALENPDVPGNAGLKDLVMALEWVQKNIQNFGGDPDNVTIFGNSAGGASTHFLVMSSLAEGLFHRAIITSGASINEWPLQRNPGEIASELMNIVGIHSENTSDLLEILWNIPIELVALIVGQIPNTDGRITPFRPVIEGEYSENAFIRDDPKDLMERGEFNQVPTLNGFTTQEGVLFLFLINNLNASRVEEIIPDFDFYIPEKIRDLLSSEEKEVVKDRIRDFYFPDNNDLINRFIDINSDQQFIKDIENSVRIFSKYSEDTYYYAFSYNGALSFSIYTNEFQYTEGAHGDELGYIFDMTPMFPIHVVPSAQDLLIRRRLVETFTNFAKFGTPTPSLSEDVNIIWKPVTEDELNYLSIGDDLSMGINPLQERMQFWKDLEAFYDTKSILNVSPQ